MVMIVHVCYGSARPVYGISEREMPAWSRVEITEQFFAEIKAVEAAYEAIQEKLEALKKQQDSSPDTRPSEMP